MQMNRDGTGVFRCTVERLMGCMGLQRAVRGKKVQKAIPDANAACPLDHVMRQCKAGRPNKLLVLDFTCVSTWQGWLYVAFVIDVHARRIMVWRVSKPCERTSSSMLLNRGCTTDSATSMH